MIRAFLLILILLPWPFMASAVTLPGATLELSVTPLYPAPGDYVTFRAQSFTGNSSNITYTWRVNGSLFDQGLGRDSISITAGLLGSVTTVSVSASENGEDRGERTYTLRPADIDVLWEADTTSLPFGGVLPLATGGSMVTFMATPQFAENGSQVSSQNIVYEWYVNGTQAPRLTGYGKNVLRIEPPVFMSAFDVRVVAETPSGSIHAEKKVTVTPRFPDIVFYENAPLLGFRFDRAITDTYTLEDEEVTVRAFPLFAPSTGASTYTWKLNNEEVPSGDSDPREITFRRTESGSGSVPVSFSLRHLEELFGRAEASFRLSF